MNSLARAPILILSGVLLSFILAVQSANAQETVQREPISAIENKGGLQQIPTPVLDSLEKEVREQIGMANSSLETASINLEKSRQQVAEAYLQLGRLYHAYELFDAAEVCYRNTGVLDPQSIEWQYNLGALLQASGRFAEALDFYQQALSLGREDRYLVLIRIGECQRSLNRLAEAKQAFIEAQQLNAEDAAVMARLGETALEEKRFAEAIAYLQKALNLQPLANKLHYPLAMAYRGLGDYEQARAHLSRQGPVGVQPPDRLKRQLDSLVAGYRIHQLVGRKAYNAERYSEAVNEFKKAVTTDPKRAEARINLASALAKLKQYPEAITQLQEAIRLEPENLTAHFNMGTTLSFMGENVKAIEHLMIVVNNSPNDAQARVILANILRDTGRLGEALEFYKAAIRLAPEQVSGWIEMSRLVSMAGQHDSARSVLEEAYSRLPNNLAIANALALQLAASPDLDLRDAKRALALAQRVYSANPDLAALRIMALATAEAGFCSKAVFWQKKAIDLAAQEKVSVVLQKRLDAELVHYQTESPCRFPAQMNLAD